MTTTMASAVRSRKRRVLFIVRFFSWVRLTLSSTSEWFGPRSRVLRCLRTTSLSPEVLPVPPFLRSSGAAEREKSPARVMPTGGYLQLQRSKSTLPAPPVIRHSRSAECSLWIRKRSGGLASQLPHRAGLGMAVTAVSAGRPYPSAAAICSSSSRRRTSSRGISSEARSNASFFPARSTSVAAFSASGTGKLLIEPLSV